MRTRILTTTIVAALAVPGAAAAAPSVAPVQTDDPVHVEVQLLRGGDVVQSFACDWRGEGPQDEDRGCLAFVGDPRAAVDAVKAAGADTGVRRTLAPAHQLDATSTTSRRADGTWLQRIVGSDERGAFHLGFVCDSAGEHCARWDAQGELRAKPRILAAAKKLKVRRR